MKQLRAIEMTVWVGVHDVERALGVGRSTAYELLRECAGRRHGDRGLLRVAVDDWEAFARRRLGGTGGRHGNAPEDPGAGSYSALPSASATGETSLVRITRPRIRRPSSMR